MIRRRSLSDLQPKTGHFGLKGSLPAGSMKPLVVFDCWGTLFYSRQVYIESIARELGADRDESDFVARFESGLMLNAQSDDERLKALTELAAHYGQSADKATACAQLLKTGMTKPAAYADVWPTLRRLRPDYTLALLTNTLEASFARLRRRFPIDDSFDAIFTSFNTGLLKPDGRAFRFVLKQTGVPADRAVMVGDNLAVDYDGARAVGMRAVLLDRTDQHPEIADQIASLLALPGWLSLNLPL